MSDQARGAIPVIIVEEQELFRRGLRIALEEAGLTVAGEYGSAAAAWEVGESGGALEPGAVVLCSMTLDGWQELVRHLRLGAPDCPVIGVVERVTDEVTVDALRSGILSCIARTLPHEEWVRRVRDAHAGKVSPARMLLEHPSVARHALMMLSQPVGPGGLRPLAPILAHRERLALANVSEGVPVSVVAEQMGVSEGALGEVLESAYHKLVARQRLSETLEQLR